MPIYAYRCEECGLTQDVLQKLSDPVLTQCPSCGKPAFKKQLTAAGISGGQSSGSAMGGMPPCMMGGGCMGGPCG
jgi:putative FmdB family regulatory protein